MCYSVLRLCFLCVPPAKEIRRFAGVFSEETPTSSTHVDEEDGSFAKHTLMNALLEEGSRTVLGDGAEKAASSKDDQPTFEDTTDVEEEAPAADVSELEADMVVDEAIEPEMQEEDKSGPFEQIPRDSEAQEVGEEDLKGEVEAIEAASKKVSSAEVPPEEIPKDIVETDLIKEEIVDNSLELELSSSIPQVWHFLVIGWYISMAWGTFSPLSCTGIWGLPNFPKRMGNSAVSLSS